jgi:hypothetical protein
MRALAASVVAAVLLLLAAATGDATPPAGLTSWWPGDGNGGDVVGAHDATLDGSVGFTAAVVGQGFVLDAVDDLVRVDDDPDLHPGTGSFTADAWARTTGPLASNGGVIIRHYECSGQCSPGTRDGDWDLRISHDGLDEGFIRDNTAGDGGGQEILGTKSVADGNFHHLALVRDVPAGKARLYVDGSLDIEVDLTADADGDISNLDDADPVTIGGGWLGGTTSPDADVAFPGVIDEVQWYRNTALTGDQIAGLCTSNVTATSSATAPATGTVGQPITVSYAASDNIGVARVILLVRTPGASGFTEAATDTTNSGSFSYTPATPGDYGFATRAEDASCGRESAPADPDAVTNVAAAATQPPPTTTPPTTTPPPPKQVPIAQIATLPSPHVCVSRRHFPIHLKGVKGLVKAVIKLTGVPARTVRGKALGLPVDLRGLPKGKVVVRITVTTKSGKRLVGKRTYHTCANKRIVKKHKKH